MGLNVDRTLKAAKKLQALNKPSEAEALHRNILDVYPKNKPAIIVLKKVRNAADHPLSLRDSDRAVFKHLTFYTVKKNIKILLSLEPRSRADIQSQRHYLILLEVLLHSLALLTTPLPPF